MKWPAVGVGLLLGLLLACQAESDSIDLPTRAALVTFTASPSPSATFTPRLILPSATPTLSPSPVAPSASPTLSLTPSPSFTASPSPSPTLIQALVVSEVGAYLRRGPGTNYEIVGEVTAGQTFSVLAYLESGAGELWYLVRLETGQQAWIAATLADLIQAQRDQIALALTQPPTAIPTLALPTLAPTLPPGANARVTGELGVNLRAGPSYNDEILQVLPKDAPLTLIGRNAAATWYEAVTVGAIGFVGWVNADYVTPLGQASQLAVTWVGPVTQAGVQCGVNIHPKDGHGDLPIPSGLTQSQWVRFPFTASPRYFASLEAAFAFFDPIVNAYYNAGVQIILVLTHETYGEVAGWDWLNMSSANWRAFTPPFASVAERIARHYGERIAAYEIWNESDTQRGDEAGVAIPPADYAYLLDQTARTLRSAAPQATLLVGGLLDSSGFYLRGVQKALGGRLPVDGIALHPYGRGAPSTSSAFAQFGSIGEVIEVYASLAPTLPLWITEIGALGAYRPGEAAQYAASLFDYLRSNYADRVAVLLWYGWSDAMHASRLPNGLVGLNDQPAAPLYQTFFSFCGR